MPDETNELRCVANQIILDLFHAKATGQIQLLHMACTLSLKQLDPESIVKGYVSTLQSMGYKVEISNP